MRLFRRAHRSQSRFSYRYDVTMSPAWDACFCFKTNTPRATMPLPETLTGSMRMGRGFVSSPKLPLSYQLS